MAIVRIRIFYLFCSCDLNLEPITFMYEADSHSLEIYHISENKLRMSRLLKVIILLTANVCIYL